MVTAKKPVAKTAVKRAVARKTAAKPAPKVVAKAAPRDMTDKILDLIKWVDNPFKLVSVILLSTIAFAGYFALILTAATRFSHPLPNVSKVFKLR